MESWEIANLLFLDYPKSLNQNTQDMFIIGLNCFTSHNFF